MPCVGKKLSLISRRRADLIAVTGIAALARCLYFMQAQASPFFRLVYATHDSSEVQKMAQAFCGGNLLLNIPGGKYPFYSYFVGVIYLVSGSSLWAVWAVQHLLGVLAACLVYETVRLVFDRRAALLSALWFAVYPQFLFYEGIMLRAAPVAFLAILALYLLVRFGNRPSWGRLATAAAATSLMAQCRANTLLVLPLVLGWIALSKSVARTSRERLVRAAGFLAVFWLVAAPLLVRAWIVDGRFVLFDSGGPPALLGGNLIDYDGLGWHHGTPRYRELIAAHGDRVYSDFPWVMRLLLKQVVDSPIEFLALYLRKIRFFLTDLEIASNNNFYLARRLIPLLWNPLGHFSAVGALAVIGGAVGIRRRPCPVVLYLFLAGMIGSVILFYNVARFRIPVVPVMMIFAGFGVATLLEWTRKRRWGLIAICLLFAVGWGIACRGPTGGVIRPLDFGMMGHAFQRIGRHDAAVPLFKESLSAKPEEDFIRRKLAFSLFSVGRYSEALHHYQKVLPGAKHDGGLHYDLALTYYFLGDRASAIRHCDRAVSLGVGAHPGFLAELQKFRASGETENP